MELLTRAYDPSHADVRVEFGFARLEFSFHAANRATADQWAATAEILSEARAHPEVFVDPGARLRHGERIEFAERAAAADIAVRLGLSESVVRAQAFDADTLRRRLPAFWAAFREGDVVVPNARCAAELVRTLPDDADLVRAFDDELIRIIGMSPARFRRRARVLRERLHAMPLAERVAAAGETRDVWLDDDVDGMAHLTLRLDAVSVHRAFARIDAAARDLARLPGEQRTLAQLRADAGAGILLTDASGAPATRVSVAVTVPVMTLLGRSGEPATLDGYGPIDAETARRLTAEAPSLTRLLTHPVSSALLDIDRTTYRVPADLRRWLGVIDQTCRFTGCGRLARTSDIDHTVDHQYGGPTRADNLAHLCRHHHRLKHMTRWTVARNPGSPGRLTWTSPTGHRTEDDPPPF
jgi:hypothetical protein